MDAGIAMTKQETDRAGPVKQRQLSTFLMMPL